MKKEKKFVAHVVSHTHWDRAWYMPFEGFRFRLTKMIKHLLNLLETDPNFKHFVFDGQMVPIEDYLEIYPQDRERIERLAKSGKLVLGPSYVLPDEYIVSAEALVRNLLIGIKETEKFGKPMMIGYYPDPFGHVSQMPQILNGFGMDSLFFMRGMGDEDEYLGREFTWQGSDGESEVTAVQSHYGNFRAVGLPFYIQGYAEADPRIALERAEELKEQRRKEQKTKYLLFFNGIDHFYADEQLAEMIKYVNKNSEDLELVHSTFDKWLKDYRAQNPKLKKFKGEIRSGKHDWILTGVSSSRMYLKQMNEFSQTLLERRLEPLGAYTWMINKSYPKEYLTYLWKTLLKNHPHDDICGCSVDPVHRDMVNRYDHIEQAGDMLMKDTLKSLLHEIKFSKDTFEDMPVVVYNTLGHNRDGYVKGNMIIPEAKAKGKKFVLKDTEGNIIPAKFEIVERVQRPWLYGEEHTFCSRLQIEFIAPDMPQSGYKTFYVSEAEKKSKASVPAGVTVFKDGMENQYYKITFNKNGSFNLNCKKSGMKYNELNLIEDCADKGDGYDFSHIKNDKAITSKNAKAKIKLTNETPFSASYTVSFDMILPESLTPDRTKRSKKLVKVPVSSEVTLWASIPRIDIKTTINNTAKDHRMRAMFPTSIKTDKISVESKFDVIDRPVEFPVIKEWRQPALQTHHVDHFASLADEKAGITFFNFGLPEYEASKTKSGITYYQVLFRSVGWLSKHDLLTRSMDAGPQMPAPEGYMLDTYTFEYSLATHKENWEEANMHLEAYSYNTPLHSRTFKDKFHTRMGTQSLPENLSFIEIKTEGILLSAIKQAESEDGLILRVANLTSEKKQVVISSYKPVKSACLTNLNEDEGNNLEVKNEKTITFSLKSKKFQTIKLKLK